MYYIHRNWGSENCKIKLQGREKLLDKVWKKSCLLTPAEIRHFRLAIPLDSLVLSRRVKHDENGTPLRQNNLQFSRTAERRG